ncbi:MAG: restriction endonuclease subunit S [Proteobacteria bacterium]|nr:restriction endonuclease subunit S [Pseudomonadota bacterium]MBU4470201.1 restriction endonuclease subunit S [Pseudomonadota bacterium]MCG2752617.1 restriction endonuclease subunit S [Desulfobacteraceae bacterium]
MSAEGWKIIKLKDICTKIGSGATPRGGKETYLSEGPYSLIRSQNVLDFSFSLNGLVFISEEQANQLNNVEVIEGDVLLNITGDSVARVCQVPKKLVPSRVNQHVAILRPNREKLLPEYLKYYLLNPKFKNFMLSMASVGGTRDALTKSMIEDFEIEMSDLPSQIQIATILSALDDKIELNRQTNATLEAIAQGIFKEWFVDFRFPGATGEMQDTLLGPIPKGWRVGTLGGFGEIICGKTPSKAVPQYFGGDIPFVKIPDMHDSVFITHTFDTLTDHGALSQRKKFVPAYSVLVSCIATVGLVALTSQQCQTNQQINAIVPINKNASLYLYFIAKSLRSTLRDLGSGGSATLNVNTKSFADIECLVPTEKNIQNFNRVVKPLFDKILELENESSALVNIRDNLLPKLMSGEIEV